MPTEPPVPFPRRPLDAHKGTCGNVLVVAGSRGMSGAAYLASKAALRTGAGLVTLACPDSIQAVLATKTTCVMTRPLPDTPEGTLGRQALEPLLGLIGRRDALALGPGLSRHPETTELIRSLVRVYLGGLGPQEPLRVVLDADGLNAFEGRSDDLKHLAGRAVLTPHPGELQRLAPGADLETEEARIGALGAFVARTGVVTLLKGQGTLVAEPPREGQPGRVYKNETGNPGMATAGSGDVLTGVIAGLLAQGLDPFAAACLGAYLHGKAGDIAARRTGWAPLIATDLLEGLIEAIRLEEARTP